MYNVNITYPGNNSIKKSMSSNIPSTVKQKPLQLIQLQGLSKKGPLFVTSQISDVQLIQLVARYWIRKGRKKSPKISIDLPFADKI